MDYEEIKAQALKDFVGTQQKALLNSMIAEQEYRKAFKKILKEKGGVTLDDLRSEHKHRNENSMTDKVQKIKDWISKEQDGLMDDNGNFENPEHEGAYHILCNLDAYIDSLQEESVSRTPTDIEAAMQEVEEKSRAFTNAHQGESSNEILAQMRGEEPVSIINNDIYEAFKAGSQWQRQQMSKDIFCQEIYNDGYKKGQDDMDARFRIGTVYANNEHVRHFEAVKKLVEENPNLSDEYKRGELEAIDLYMGMELFSHDVDKAVLRKTAEEQARIVRNRLEQRYSEAVKQQRIDMNTYTQITVCIEAVYQELFFAGFNVGLGELIGPQKITLNKEEEDLL